MSVLKTYLLFLLKLIPLCILLLFCGLMFSITFPYLLPPFPTDIDFLSTKQDVIDIDYWRYAFYAHIGSSFVVLVSGLFQFSKTLMFRYPKIHRNIGKLYVALILLVSAPTGLIMAAHANGGIVAIMAFVLQAILWWTFTFLAYTNIRQGKVRQHGKWMLRSYAMTLSAITLRSISFMVGLLGVYIPYEILYRISAWSSWGVNLIIVEVLMAMGLLGYYFRK